MAIDGWAIFAHPLLLDQLEKLVAAVEKVRRSDPDGFANHANTKLLAMLRRLIFETVPADPTRPEYRQGDTLGQDRKHWFRAKFGNGRFRLFFRFDSRTRVIIFAWVNDESTLRTCGAKTDAYAVFRKMLASGNPPDDWADLLREASAGPTLARLEEAKPGPR